MLNAQDITKFVDWLIERKLVSYETPEHRTKGEAEFHRVLQSLTTEDMRRGCKALNDKRFKLCPHPIAYRALATGEWKPSENGEAARNIQAMRQACKA